MFTKQDLLALPFGVAVHLLATRNGRALAVWAATGALAACVLLALTFRLDGHCFFANLLRPRAYVPRNLGRNVLGYGLHLGTALAISVSILVRFRAIAFRGLLLVLLLATHLTSIFLSGGDGVATNIFYPSMIALAVSCAAALCSLGNVHSRTRHADRLLIAALVVPAMLSAVFVPFRLDRDLAARRNLAAATKDAREAARVLRSVHGPVICETILLCYQAGRTLDYDPYFVNDQVLIGRIRESEMLGMLTSHRYAAIEIDGVVDTASPLATSRRRFTKAFMQTLSAEYRLVRTDGTYSIFEPRRQASHRAATMKSF